MNTASKRPHLVRVKLLNPDNRLVDSYLRQADYNELLDSGLSSDNLREFFWLSYSPAEVRYMDKKGEWN